MVELIYLIKNRILPGGLSGLLPYVVHSRSLKLLKYIPCVCLVHQTQGHILDLARFLKSRLQSMPLMLRLSSLMMNYQRGNKQSQIPNDVQKQFHYQTYTTNCSLLQHARSSDHFFLQSNRLQDLSINSICSFLIANFGLPLCFRWTPPSL